MWEELKERLKNAAECRDNYIEKLANEAVDLIFKDISDALDNQPDKYLTIAKEDSVSVRYEYDDVNLYGHPEILDILRDRVQENLPYWISVNSCEKACTSSSPPYGIYVNYEISKEIY